MLSPRVPKPEVNGSIECAYGYTRPASKAEEETVDAVIAKYRDREGFAVIKTSTVERVGVTVLRVLKGNTQ